MDRTRNLSRRCALLSLLRLRRRQGGIDRRIGAQFYAEFMDRIHAPASLRDAQNDQGNWLERSSQLTELFRTRTSDEWLALLEGTDACVAPVLDLSAAPFHPHMIARQTYIEQNGDYRRPRLRGFRGNPRSSKFGTDRSSYGAGLLVIRLLLCRSKARSNPSGRAIQFH